MAWLPIVTRAFVLSRDQEKISRTRLAAELMHAVALFDEQVRLNTVLLRDFVFGEEHGDTSWPSEGGL